MGLRESGSAPEDGAPRAWLEGRKLLTGRWPLVPTLIRVGRPSPPEQTRFASGSSLFLLRILMVPQSGSTSEKLRPGDLRPSVAWKGRPKAGDCQTPGECAGGPAGETRWQCPGLRGPCARAREGLGRGWMGTGPTALPSKASAPWPKAEDREAP